VTSFMAKEHSIMMMATPIVVSGVMARGMAKEHKQRRTGRDMKANG
jgi:hypothetical protein